MAARSTVPGIVLEGASVISDDPGSNPFGEGRCNVAGSVRNDTPDKILQAMVLTAFDSEGSVMATAHVERFEFYHTKPTVRPGESAGFFEQLLGLHTCNDIVRIELTEAFFG